MEAETNKETRIYKSQYFSNPTKIIVSETFKDKVKLREILAVAIIANIKKDCVNSAD